MYLGPLEAQKPWNTRDIVGMSRFSKAFWRNLIGATEETPWEGDASPASPQAAAKPRIGDAALPEAVERQLHRTIKKVAQDIESLRFNTAIAELIKVNTRSKASHNCTPVVCRTVHFTYSPPSPPTSPRRSGIGLGHEQSLARQPWPAYDPISVVETTWSCRFR